MKSVQTSNGSLDVGLAECGGLSHLRANLGGRTLNVLGEFPETTARTPDIAFTGTHWWMVNCPGRVAARKGKTRTVLPGVLYFQGKQIPLGDAAFQKDFGIHGIACRRTWALEKGEFWSPGTEVLRATLRASDHPEDFPKFWPEPYDVDVEVGLDGSTMRIETTLTNVGNEPMLGALGWHPFWPRTLDPAVGKEVPEICFDAWGIWPKRQHFIGGHEQSILLPLKNPEALGKWSYQSPAPLQDWLDHCYASNGGPATIVWPKSKVKAVIDGGKSLPFKVIYSPAYHKLFGRNFALEVQSSASNAPGLREAGMPKESIGWVELEPGKSLETEVTVSVSEITG